MKFRPRQVIGVDLDASLIDKAKRHIAYKYSLLRVPKEESAEEPVPKFYPLCFPVKYGYIPIAASAKKHKFPYNIEFRSEDWTEGPPEKELYDVIFW